MGKFPVTDIYALTDAALSLGRSTTEVVKQMLEAKIKVIQYREKNLSSGAMLTECLAIRELTKEAGCLFIVNDHVDIALLAKADGVHVGQDDLPLAAVRSLVGGSMIIGVSVRSMKEAQDAIAGGADYLGVGAVFSTTTKKDAVDTGLSLLTAITAISPVPVVAIGGIGESNIQLAAQYGATCFAIISAITTAPNIPQKVAALRKLIKE